MYFVFKRSLSNYKHFSEIFWALHIDYSQYEKTILGIFVYLFIYEVTATKVNFVFRNSAVKPQHVLFENDPFLRKMLVSFFSSDILLYIGKNPVEKLLRFWKWNLKRKPQSA